MKKKINKLIAKVETCHQGFFHWRQFAYSCTSGSVIWIIALVNSTSLPAGTEVHGFLGFCVMDHHHGSPDCPGRTLHLCSFVFLTVKPDYRRQDVTDACQLPNAIGQTSPMCSENPFPVSTTRCRAVKNDPFLRYHTTLALPHTPQLPNPSFDCATRKLSNKFSSFFGFQKDKISCCRVYQAISWGLSPFRKLKELAR